MFLRNTGNRLPSDAPSYPCSTGSSIIPPRILEDLHIVKVLLALLVGHAVAQLVEALSYKLEGHGFCSRWYYWNFSFSKSFRSHYGRGVDSASNRNEYQEYFLGSKGGRCLGLTNLQSSCVECLEIWSLNPLYVSSKLSFSYFLPRSVEVRKIVLPM
jgi:hypothetical protein